MSNEYVKTERQSMPGTPGIGNISPPEREMPRVLRMLENEVSRLESLLDDLGGRIGCVLSLQCSPEVAAGRPVKEISTDLPGMIATRVYNIAGLNDRLASMIGRIEL